MFQSAPGFGAGGNRSQWASSTYPRCFNPPPALGPGETSKAGYIARGLNVSIRPRLWGRGKPRTTSRRSPAVRFQSAPGFGAGGNSSLIRSSREVAMFQSAPGFGAGGNLPACRGPMSSRCFNPPPALGPGETEARTPSSGRSRVSIRPRLWGRGKQGILERGTVVWPVSIRPRLWGRGKPSRCHQNSSTRLFQSAPGFGAGGN